MNLKLLTGTHETYIFAFGALALFGAITYWHNASFPPSRSNRPLAIFLKTARTLAFLAVALLSFNPSLSYDRTETEKGKFLFVFDKSLSMGFSDSAKAGASRFESAAAALADGRVIEKIGEANDTQFAVMDAGLTPVKGPADALGAVPGGPTDISAALGALMQRSDLSGALIVSDGRNTGGIAPESLARYVKFPVFTLGTGANSGVRDAAVADASYPRSAYLNEECEIAAEISASGIEGAATTLTLKENGEVRRQVPVSLDRARRQVKVPLKPSRTGLVKYQLSLAPVDGEITTQNNDYSFFVNVTEHKIRILAIQSSPDADFSYMLKFFASSKDIKFSAKFLNTPNQRMLLKQSDLEGGFDILVLGNIDLVKMEPLLLKKIENVLSSGNASVLFTGGPDLSVPAEGPLADRFPLDMTGRVLAYEPAAYKPSPNTGAAASQIAKLSPIAKINSYMWNDIPELCGLNYLKTAGGAAAPVPRGPATVLYASFTCPATRGPVETPVLAVRNSPGKKSAALLGGSFWFLKAGQLFSKNAAFYDRFVSNLILWLYSKEDDRAFKVETDRANYYEGDRVFVSVSARNRDFSPMVNPSFTMTLAAAGGGGGQIKPQMTIADEGFYEFSFPAAAAGEHEITVAASEPGGKKDSMAARFIVLNSSKEMLDVTADYECLKKISEKTGGRFYEKENAASIVADAPKRGGEKTVRVVFSPFESGPVLGFVFSLLCLEWAVRRYSGLE